jgi:membrane protease YdiL (CAAX protease family)
MLVVGVIVSLAAAFLEHPEIFKELVNSSQNSAYPSPDVDAALTALLAEAITDAALKYAGLSSILGMLCGLPWFFIIRGKKLVSTDVTQVHSKAAIGTLLALFAIVLGVQFVMIAGQAVIEQLFNQGGSSLSDALDESMTELALSTLGALYIVIIGPICEELVFRGAVMRSLERYGANFAIIVSSLLFGLYHMILFQAAFAFLIGIVLAYTAGRFSLKWSMLLHMLNNGIATLTIYVNNDLFAGALVLVFFLALIAAIVILIVRRKLIIAQKRAGAPSEPKVFARAFKSPWLISYVALTTLIALWPLVVQPILDLL